jgi:hypothetical protein
MLKTFVPATFVLVSSLAAQSQAPVGSLGGSVSDQQGNALAGAEVRYVGGTRIAGSRPGPGETVVGGTVITDANGQFAVSGMPAGDYSLCADVPSAAYLDPCIWQQPVFVTVPATGTGIATLALSEGVFLKVRVNDPLGLLPSTVDGLWTLRKLVVGVTYANGAYQGAQNVSVDATGRNYQLIVPPGVAFNLRLFSRDVALTDAVGASVDISGSLIPFQAAEGQDQSFTFTVSGPAAPQAGN